MEWTLPLDGVRSVPWSPPASVSNNTHLFVPAKSGGFGINYGLGLSHIRGNRIVSHINLGAPPGQIVEEQDGSLWVTTWRRPGSPGPLCHASDPEVRSFGKADGLAIQIALPILSDGPGGFWIGNDTSLVRWKAGEGTEVQLIAPSAVAYEKPRNGAGFRPFRKLRVHEHRS